jgi:integrase
MIDAAPAGQWRALCVLGIRTGLRIGELFALRWGDVDFPNRKVHVRRAVYKGIETTPKGGQARDVPMTRQTVEALEAIRSDRAEGYVFANSDGSPHGRGEERKHLQAIARAAGVKPHGVHVLRPTFGSHCAMRGVSLREIQALMGHSSITVTERYAHLMPSAGDRLDALDGPRLKAVTTGATAVQAAGAGAVLVPSARPENG